ncbi:nickel/cobalt transporter [Xanthobacteraceae bacterium A53D]
MYRPAAVRPLVLVLAGTGLALAALALLVLAIDPAFAQAALGQPKTSPFGLGAAAPPPTGITGYIIAKQSEFYRALVQAVRAAKADGNALYLLAGLSFGYGVLHAAGPGHGKAVISSYLLADGGTLKRGAVLAFAAGMVQASAAVLFVGILAVVLGATAVSMARAMNFVEIAAYGAIALFGAVLAYRKLRTLIAVLRGEPAVHVHGPDCGCGDKHAPDPHLLDGRGGWKRAAVAVISAGARPCSGAILVLTFALSQGVFLTGVASAFAMGLGTALTVTAIAALAVYGKRLAVKLAVAASGRGTVVVLLVELGAALLVLAFGLALLTGYAASERLLPGG